MHGLNLYTIILSVWLSADELAHQGKVRATKPEDWAQSLEPTWEERTHSKRCPLISHTLRGMHMPTHTHLHTKNILDVAKAMSIRKAGHEAMKEA